MIAVMHKTSEQSASLHCADSAQSAGKSLKMIKNGPHRQMSSSYRVGLEVLASNLTAVDLMAGCVSAGPRYS